MTRKVKLPETVKHAVLIDWSGITAVAQCPLCDYQTFDLDYRQANKDASVHWKHRHASRQDIPRLCAYADCNREHKAYGLCHSHYDMLTGYLKRGYFALPEYYGGPSSNSPAGKTHRRMLDDKAAAGEL